MEKTTSELEQRVKKLEAHVKFLYEMVQANAAQMAKDRNNSSLLHDDLISLRDKLPA